jgi:hypothetical protein
MPDQDHNVRTMIEIFSVVCVWSGTAVNHCSITFHFYPFLLNNVPIICEF